MINKLKVKIQIQLQLCEKRESRSDPGAMQAESLTEWIAHDTRCL